MREHYNITWTSSSEIFVTLSITGGRSTSVHHTSSSRVRDSITRILNTRRKQKIRSLMFPSAIPCQNNTLLPSETDIRDYCTAHVRFLKTAIGSKFKRHITWCRIQINTLQQRFYGTQKLSGGSTQIELIKQGTLQWLTYLYQKTPWCSNTGSKWKDELNLWTLKRASRTLVAK